MKSQMFMTVMLMMGLTAHADPAGFDEENTAPIFMSFVGPSQAGELNSTLFAIDGGGLVRTRTGAGHFFQEVVLHEIICNEDLAPASKRSVECTVSYSESTLGTPPYRTKVLDGEDSLALKDAFTHLGVGGVVVAGKETLEASEVICEDRPQMDRSLTPECSFVAIEQEQRQ